MAHKVTHGQTRVVKEWRHNVTKREERSTQTVSGNGASSRSEDIDKRKLRYAGIPIKSD